MTKIKICGITREEDARACAEMGSDFIGFVFVRDSKRYVAPERAAEIGRYASREVNGAQDARAPKRARPLLVGVFRDQPVDEVLQIADIARLDLIQLHGEEDDAYVQAMNRPVIKAMRLDAVHDTSAPYVMFDSGGGTGHTFDWSLVEAHRPAASFFLAGGLTPENVREAIRVTRPFAVDVSTGVESAPGIKDHQKIQEFIQRVRSL